ncbi:MAG: Gfo/Idh/MocA family oxidoreductase [Anaerolineae bacterium]|nr:Gfo/Idh/MocA family oxidoreductase [Thermoflexales bacterium]MDW8408272.1 Gfo/Idh/MocA family oxidoreductase [Anaerolineae bacterium]
MIRLGVIGTGGMANYQASQFSKIEGVRITACCDVSAERRAAFAQKFNVPAVYADYREMLEKEQLDGVTNVTPDAMHAEVSIAVLEKRIPILCEKPMATTLDDAKRMLEAAEKAGVIHMVNFSYRNSSALQAAAQAVRAGAIGELRHVESSYLQSWLVSKGWGDWRESPGLLWRLSTKHGSAGDLGDIGVHIYDLTSFLCGDIAEIYCKLRTFDKGVPGNQIGEYVLDANDSFVSTVMFANGAIGAIHSSRWAVGHSNSLRARVYGTAGAIEIDLDRAYDEYRICAGEENMKTYHWETVKCPPTPSNYERFIEGIRTGKRDASDFVNGVKIQAYLHYSFESDRLGRPVRIEI